MDGWMNEKDEPASWLAWFDRSPASHQLNTDEIRQATTAAQKGDKTTQHMRLS